MKTTRLCRMKMPYKASKWLMGTPKAKRNKRPKNAQAGGMGDRDEGGMRKVGFSRGSKMA
jgi:hypothetical protein